MWSLFVALCAVATSGVSYQATPVSPMEQTLNPAPQTRKFDEYGNIRFNDEKARLDNLAITLHNDPTSKAYIIGYGGIICQVGEALARAKRAKDYLNISRGIDAERIITRNGGYRHDVGAELYVVPLGAGDPPSHPTIARCKKPPRRRTR